MSGHRSQPAPCTCIFCCWLLVLWGANRSAQKGDFCAVALAAVASLRIGTEPRFAVHMHIYSFWLLVLLGANCRARKAGFCAVALAEVANFKLAAGRFFLAPCTDFQTTRHHLRNLAVAESNNVVFVHFCLFVGFGALGGKSKREIWRVLRNRTGGKCEFKG